MIKAFADNAKTIETATEAIIQFTISTFEAFNSLRQFLGFQTEQEKLIERQNELLKERARIQKTLDFWPIFEFTEVKW